MVQAPIYRALHVALLHRLETSISFQENSSEQAPLQLIDFSILFDLFENFNHLILI